MDNTLQTTYLHKHLICLYLLFMASIFRCQGMDKGDFFYFNNYKSSNSGLSFDCVYAIIQDSNGFIWIGTSNGLNRFDGVKFATFYKEDLGIHSAFITFLMEDSKGNIWIGTDHGLCMYDIRLDQFIPFDKKSDKGSFINNKVRYIREDLTGKIWLAVNEQGLFSYDPQSNALINYFADSGKTKLPANITSFLFDSDNTCWIAFYHAGLWVSDEHFTELKPVRSEKIAAHFRGDNIVDMATSSEGTFLIASVNHGLCSVSPRFEQIRTLISNKEESFLPEAVRMDRNGRYFLATDMGIYVYDPFYSDYFHIYPAKISRFSLSDSKIHSILIDDSGGLWVGTQSSGVDYSPLHTKNFQKVTNGDNYSLEKSLVRSFAEDANGDI